MKIKELKEKLKNMPDDMDVMIPRVDGDAMFTLLETVEVRSIRFHECEESDGNCECEAVAHVECLILDEE